MTRSPVRAGRPAGVDSAETRERLLDAAERQFSAVGFSFASNRTIAADARLTTSAIYHHFGSKLGLYVAVDEHVHAIIYGRYRVALEGARDFRARLRAVVEASIELHRERPTLAAFRARAAAEARVNPQLAGLIDEHLAQLNELTRAVVGDGAESGDGRFDGVEPADVANMVGAVLLGFAQYAELADSPETHARAFRAFETLLR